MGRANQNEEGVKLPQRNVLLCKPRKDRQREGYERREGRGSHDQNVLYEFNKKEKGERGEREMGEEEVGE